MKRPKKAAKNVAGLQHYLRTIDKIKITVDKIAESIQTYQQEQALNSNTLSKHEDRLEKIETHLNLSTTL